MRWTILASLAALIPACAFSFWSSYEIHIDGFRERPWITVLGGRTNEATTSFLVIFDYDDYLHHHGEEYLHLDLRDENDNSLSYTPLRGEPIRRAMPHEAVVSFGCETLWTKGTATVYRFTVSSHLLTKSRLSWQFVPPSDELGNASTGGVLEWCYLSTLAQANRNANKDGAATGSHPSWPEPKPASSAAGSRR